MTLKSKLFTENRPVLILFCRHLGSKSCRKEILKLWEKVSPADRESQRLILVYGSGDPSSLSSWESSLGCAFTSFRDEGHETFSHYGIYSGLMAFNASGLLIKKIPLALLEAEPPTPYKFLKSREFALLSKM